MRVNFDRGWQPDYLPFGIPPGGLAIASNLLPYDEFYAPALSKAPYVSGALSGTPLNGYEFKANDDSYASIVGTSSKLYRIQGKSITDATNVLGGYNATSWSYAQYGDWVIAVNSNNKPQVLKGISTEANFVDLGGSPPTAEYALSFKGRIIFGNVAGSDQGAKTLTWSALEDPENWTQDILTGSDSQVLADAEGPITGLVSLGESFLIFHENSISAGYFSSDPILVFNFVQRAVRNIGCIIPGSIIGVETRAYFWGNDNIYSYDGVALTPIGDGVRKTILNAVDPVHYNRVTSCYDTSTGLIYWSFPSTQSTGAPDRMIVYNPRKNRFTRVDNTVSAIFQTHIGGVDIDSMDATYPSIDAMSSVIDIDSRFWLSNQVVIGGVDNDTNTISTLSGSALDSEIETAEVADESESVFLVTKVKPLIQRAVDPVNISMASRFLLTDDPTYTSPAPVNQYGYADMLVSGRYLKMNMKAKNHSGIFAADVVGQPTGKN